MDRFVYRRITFPKLCRLPAREYCRLNKCQVLQLCGIRPEDGTDTLLCKLGFMGIKYVRYLDAGEIDQIFAESIVHITKQLVSSVFVKASTWCLTKVSQIAATDLV